MTVWDLESKFPPFLVGGALHRLWTIQNNYVCHGSLSRSAFAKSLKAFVKLRATQCPCGTRAGCSVRAAARTHHGNFAAARYKSNDCLLSFIQFHNTKKTKDEHFNSTANECYTHRGKGELRFRCILGWSINNTCGKRMMMHT